MMNKHKSSRCVVIFNNLEDMGSFAQAIQRCCRFEFVHCLRAFWMRHIWRFRKSARLIRLAVTTAVSDMFIV